jgi:predicted peroxiredoxin
MRKLSIIIGLLFFSLLVANPLQAKEDKSMGLFINLTSFQKGAAGHALHFANVQMERGHPVTLFLNQQSVLFAAKGTPMGAWPMSGKTIREMLADLMKKGAKVVVCQMCAQMQNVDESDLIKGAKMGNPELVADTFFDPKYQVITW